jgi:hypothetical protein
MPTKPDKPKNPKSALEPTQSIPVRIKVEKYRLIEEVIEVMVAKNPYARGSLTPESIVRTLVDDFLIEHGKLKKS